ncbi:hypothetical protein HGRIS_009421 [Hohenbuehelia grisea]|uniref:Beta-glucuronidase C-terminal domain-containing protein n=1 Tax=Hohenbuehelia grisea TaxID=104357 RepID=A0ABR3J140_9AGAR
MFPHSIVSVLLFQSLLAFAANVQLSISSSPPSSHVVEPNFLGISYELSFMNEYIGNDTSSIPPAVINYMKIIRSRTAASPLRFRVGGNSMDTSVYVPSQKSPMMTLTNASANANNQPVDYGPMLWQVLKQVQKQVGGAEFLIGLSLLDPNGANMPVLAGAAKQGLGDALDAFLLGNEPDLYTPHQNRPNLKNYTVDNYIDEFTTAMNHLTDTSAGNVLALSDLAGPTICCNWDLASLLQQGYLSHFSNVLKYITLQHYPQNNCFGRYEYELPYYMAHDNVVKLAGWQQNGINYLLSNSSWPKLIMSEFNSASCGGIPGISDTFAVGALWSSDYALQLAASGYSAAYLHTRERGISYNIFAPPAPEADAKTGAWTTNPAFYSLLFTADALNSNNGSIVVDLNVANSRTNPNATTAAYAVFDANNPSALLRAVMFNYANGTSEPFDIPAGNLTSAAAGKTLTVKFLTAASAAEKTNIAWGGKTFAGVGDGNMVAAPADATWATQDQRIDCSNGCTVTVPGPGAAILMVADAVEARLSQNAATASIPRVGTIMVGLISALGLWAGLCL